MKKLLLISLIIGTALSQMNRERNRIALLRRRQNLSERELNNGGFLQSGSSRVSEGFRGSEPSFDEFSGRRRRFQSNVVVQNVDSPVSRRRNYLQSLRSTLRRNGGRRGRVRGSFRNKDRPVNEQNVRRTYMPAIKRPRFTPNIRDILPRRMPSYSPTARGINSNWTPRLPSTVSGAGNFLPSNMNDFIERTNPVNDRSYVSPKKPSLIVEPIPLPTFRDPEQNSAKEPIPSQTHKPDYVAPLHPVLPDQHKPDYASPMNPVLPVKHKTDYAAPMDPVLPVKHKTDYVAPMDPVLPVQHKTDYVAPMDPVLPVQHKTDYASPMDPVLPVKHKTDYASPMDPVLPVQHKTDYASPMNPVLPVQHKTDNVAPMDPVLPVQHKTDYVAPMDPVLPVQHKTDNVAPMDPVLPVQHKTDYVAPMDPVLPVQHKTDYVAPTDLDAFVRPNIPLVSEHEMLPLPSLPKIPFDAIDPLSIPPVSAKNPSYDPSGSVVSKLETLPDVKDPNYIVDAALNGPLDPLDPSTLPLDINDSGYVDPMLSPDPLGHLTLPMKPELPKAPKNVKDSNYVVDKELNDLLGPLDLSTFPLDINDPSYVDPMLSPDPLGPFTSPMNPKLPTNVKDPNYFADKVMNEPLGPLDSSSLLLDINDQGYVDPAQTDPLSPLTNVKDPNYVADQVLKEPLGPLNSPSLPLDINEPGYVDPALSDPLGPLPTVKDTSYVADPMAIDPSGTLDIPAFPLKDTNYIGSEQIGPLDAIAPLDISGMPSPALPSFPVDVNDPNYVEPPAIGLVDPLDQLPFGPFGAADLGLDPLSLSIDQMNPFGPLTPLGTLDSSAVLHTNKPGYVPPNESTVGSMDPIGDPLGDPFDQRFPDTLPIPTDSLNEPRFPTGGLISDPLASSKNGNPNYVPSTDPQALVIDNQANAFPDAFGPLDLPQDPIISRGPSEQLPPDNVSPKDGSLLLPPDTPSLPGLLDPLNTDFGSNGGSPDLLMHPSNYKPEPPLPHSPLFDSNIPPVPDMNGFNLDPFTPDMNGSPLDPSIPDMNGSPWDPPIPDMNGSPWDPPIPDINGSPWDPPIPDMNGSPVDPAIPDEVMTRSEINEAARREYAKSAGAFDPKWNNPNVRNSNLYVEAKPVNPSDARPARVKTLFDFTAGTAGADFINTAVDKVSEKTQNIMTAKSKRREGYLSKYDALRSYEG